MSWSSVINQSRVKHMVKVSLERKRLAHAYVFSGDEGVGTYSVAIELAKVLNCSRGGMEACDSCPDCLKVLALQHPNVNLVFALPVGKGEKVGDSPLAKLPEEDITVIREQLQLKSKNPYHALSIPRATGIKINSIREIRRESSLSTFGDGKKIFVILEADMLNDEASNALLKTLEEPHDRTYLFLTTSRPDSLLPTIMSRCQHIRFDPLTEQDIQQALQEREGVASEQAAMIARVAKGSYARALQYVNTPLGERRNEAVNLLRTVLHQSRKDLLDEIDRIVREYERPDVEELLMMTQQWLRDAMLWKEGIDASVDDEERTAIKKFVAHYTNMDYVRALEQLDRSISLLNKNVYIPLILLNLAHQLKVSTDQSPAVARVTNSGSSE